MRNRFDYLVKEIGQAALRYLGTVTVHAEIRPEPQYADLCFEPDPARRGECPDLGLLGRLAVEPCIFEVYSDAPGPAELRACLAKHLAFWQQRVRVARRGAAARSAEEDVAPFLWIIAAGAPTTLLTKLRPAPGLGWPPGVYFFGDDIFRVGLVVASELPGDPSTLLVRIMAGGPLLGPAVGEVATLPRTALTRVIAEPALLQLQHELRQEPSPDPREQEFIMAMIKSWEDGRAEARREGHREGRREGYQAMLLRQLRQRFGGEVDARVEQRVVAATTEQIEEWIGRVLSAPTLLALLGD
jgi:hypothetical protein